MKKFLILIILLVVAMPVKAGYYDNFRVVDEDSIKPFARDLGGVLGSGSAQTARSLGFSGFDLGVRAAAQVKPSKNNTIMQKDKMFGLGVVQVELGMPYRIDCFVRGNVYEGLSIVGGGLRYGLWNVSDEPYKLNASLTAMGNMVTNKNFYAVHLNSTLILSMNMPAISPYIAAGVDSTYLQAQTVDSAAMVDKSVRVTMPRYTFGIMLKMVRLKTIGLLYLSSEATYTHGQYVIGATSGLRF